MHWVDVSDEGAGSPALLLGPQAGWGGRLLTRDALSRVLRNQPKQAAQWLMRRRKACWAELDLRNVADLYTIE